MSNIKKEKVSVTGVIVHGNGLNVEEAKTSIEIRYGTKDKHGKKKTVIFDEADSVTNIVVTD